VPNYGLKTRRRYNNVECSLRGWHQLPLMAGSHMTPSHLRSIRAISAVENVGVWDLPLHTGPKYDVDVYVATYFGGEACNLC
jgi:hypothetical protein